MRWLLSWAFYWAGDIVSRWNDNDARFTEAGYRLYQWLMLKAHDLQGDGKGPWQ